MGDNKHEEEWLVGFCLVTLTNCIDSRKLDESTTHHELNPGALYSPGIEARPTRHPNRTKAGEAYDPISFTNKGPPHSEGTSA